MKKGEGSLVPLSHVRKVRKLQSQHNTQQPQGGVECLATGPHN